MLSAIKSLFGMGPKADFKQLVAEGAIIIDVRTKEEFKSGHIKNAMNIPVQEISSHVAKLKSKNKPIITCCRSGMRSGSAKSILQSAGIDQVYNGGPWTSLEAKIK